MEEALFTWVHLSDIHVGHGSAGHGWDQQLVMDALRRDIAARKEPLRIDAMLVTGDVAFSGNGRSKDEYARAEAWLVAAGEAAGLGRDRIFLVPGNHDVNRDVDRRLDVGPLVDNLRSGRLSVDQVLVDAKGTELLADRMDEYLKTAARFAPGCLTDPRPARSPLFWVHTVAGREGLRVRLVGLNTALLCKDDTDYEHLQLGNAQLAKALLPAVAAEGELVFVLGHHPLQSSWMADHKDAFAWISNHAHVHLSGHVHEAQSEELRRGHGGLFVNIVAGAVHGEQMPKDVPASHGYSFGAVVRGQGAHLRLRIWPRRWSDKAKAFRVDADVVGDGERSADHDLRGTLPEAAKAEPPARPAEQSEPARSGGAAAVVHPPPRLPATGPVEVFLSYAPADERMKQELVKALAQQRRSGEIAIHETRRGEPQVFQGAQIILLLLSKDYLADDYCYEVELEGARLLHEAGEATVMVVLLRDVELVTRAEFKRVESGARRVLWYESLDRLPYASGRDQNHRPTGVDQDGKPVEGWARADDAWTEVARELRDAVEAWRRRPPSA